VPEERADLPHDFDIVSTSRISVGEPAQVDEHDAMGPLMIRSTTSAEAYRAIDGKHDWSAASGIPAAWRSARASPSS
jgi:hypothetical protein